MEKALISNLHQLFPNKTDTLLIGVSGGVDSMVLLDVLVSQGFQCLVAHCNFGLRSEASDADEKFVVDWCAAHNVEALVHHVDLKLALQEGHSVQMAARDARYLWFKELLASRDINKVLVGSHKNDNAETVLLNLTRGMGHQSLTGMDTELRGVVRPLLPFSKAEILALAKKRGLTWREDASNASNKYERNVIRNVVMPELVKLRPNAVDNIHQSALALQQSYGLLHDFIRLWKLQYVTESNEEHFFRFIGFEVVSEPELLLFELVKLKGFSYQSVAQLYASKQPGKKIESNTHELWKGREGFTLKPTKSNDFAILISSLPFTVSTPIGSVHLEEVSYTKGMERSCSSSIVMFDLEQLSTELALRTWQAGDVIKPFGLKGSQKVSDVLTNNKVDVAARGEQLVLTDQDEVLWVVGLRAAQKAKLTGETQRVLKVALT